MYGVPETETTPSAAISFLGWFVQPWRILRGLGEFLHAIKDNVLHQNKRLDAHDARIKELEILVRDGVANMRKQFTAELRKKS